MQSQVAIMIMPPWGGNSVISNNISGKVVIRQKQNQSVQGKGITLCWVLVITASSYPHNDYYSISLIGQPFMWAVSQERLQDAMNGFLEIRGFFIIGEGDLFFLEGIM
jgi:hypothetical protein